MLRERRVERLRGCSEAPPLLESRWVGLASRRDRFCGSGCDDAGRMPVRHCDAMPDVCQWRCGKAPLALGAIGVGTVLCLVVVS